jgi:hypothetical protein
MESQLPPLNAIEGLSEKPSEEPEKLGLVIKACCDGIPSGFNESSVPLVQ